VRRIVYPFAGMCVRRPYTLGPRVSEVQRGEPADVALLKEGSSISGGDIQPPTEAGLRQEVSEPIRLGTSSLCERSQRGEVERGYTTPAPNL
jgi:hypothetical protein